MEPEKFQQFCAGACLVFMFLLLLIQVVMESKQENDNETRLQTIEKRLDSLTLDKEKTNVENP